MPRTSLDDILGTDDEFDLLKVRPLSKPITEMTRIQASFEEINVFIDQHGRLPAAVEAQGKRSSAMERGLSYRLDALRRDKAAAATLVEMDRHRLLAGLFDEAEAEDPDASARQSVEGAPPEPVGSAAAHDEPLSLDDIIGLDDDLLTGPADEIFNFRHARSPSAKSDRVAERRRSADFHLFKPLLDACVADLKSGRRVAIPFANEQEIRAGEFFILHGITAYIAEVNDPHLRGKTNRYNARLRVIFDNGTESDHLLRSFARNLYADPNGRRITDPDGGPLFEQKVTTGHIYVVRSLSKLPQIDRIRDNLVKIGVTGGTVEARLAGAQMDPTFLFAPVKLVETHELQNVDPRVVENLLHRFFIDARLDMEIPDRFGKPYKPKEWFLLPLDVVGQAIELLLNRTITNFAFDAETGTIVRTIER